MTGRLAAPCGPDRPGPGRRPPASPPVQDGLGLARTRLLAGALLFVLAFATVGGRLVSLGLQTGLPAAPVAVAGQPATRGDILDRNGVVLAIDLPSASLFARPGEIPDPRAAARRLATALPELDESGLLARLGAPKAFVWLKRGLAPGRQDAVNRLGIPGLDFTAESRRVYPHGRLLSHILGFTDVDNRGLAGLERWFESSLAQGEALHLSVDVRIQRILHEELSAQIGHFHARGGAGLVMDATNGETLALVSLPDFDANHPGAAPVDARFNRATLGVYELGSVFKIFNHALALENGLAGPDRLYDATRPLQVSRRFRISDYHPENRWLTATEVFIHSSNIGAAQMAMQAGGAAQRRFLRRLGMFDRVGLELPERGLPIWPDPWRAVNTMTVSYGHGLAVSPAHLTAGVAAMVNGGVFYPPTLRRRGMNHEVDHDVDHDADSGADHVAPGTRVLQPATSREIRRLLHLAVTQGTGRRAHAPGYEMGGKTGTAEKLENGRYKPGHRISSFVGAFPVHAPRYVLFVMLDEPRGLATTGGFATGGWVAAPVVGRVAGRMGVLLGMTPAWPAPRVAGPQLPDPPVSNPPVSNPPTANPEIPPAVLHPPVPDPGAIRPREIRNAAWRRAGGG